MKRSPKTGHILCAKWCICDRVGKGSFGELFIGRNILNGTLCAIKVQNEDIMAGLGWESEVLKQLQHSSRTPDFIHFSQYANSQDFIVMELLGGEDMASLRSRLRTSPACPAFAGGMSMQLAAHCAKEMLACVRVMHENGFIHRDIKAANFVRKYARGSSFCIVDFGITKQHVDRATGAVRPARESAEFRGTTLYSSPGTHHSRDQSFVDDLWGLMFVFIDLLVGQLPWSEFAREKDKNSVGALKDQMVDTPKMLIDWMFSSSDESSVEGSSGEGASDYVQITRIATEHYLLEIFTHLKCLHYGDRCNYTKLDELLDSIISESSGICKQIYERKCVDICTGVKGGEVREVAAFERDVSAPMYRELGGSEVGLAVWQGGLDTRIGGAEGEDDLCWDIQSGASSTCQFDTLSMQDIILARSKYTLESYHQTNQSVTSTGNGVKVESRNHVEVSTQVMLRVWCLLTQYLLKIPARAIQVDVMMAQKSILEATNYFYEYGQQLVREKKSDSSRSECSDYSRAWTEYCTSHKLMYQFKALMTSVEENHLEFNSFSSYDTNKERMRRAAPEFGSSADTEVMAAKRAKRDHDIS